MERRNRTSHEATVLVATALAAGLVGCTDPEPGRGWRPSSGTVALSSDDARLFVSDADHAALVVLDATQGNEVGRVALGGAPAEVLADDAGGAFLALRGSGEVVHVARDLSIDRRATLGGEPVGLALSPARDRLFVANGAAGTLAVLETATLALVREVEVGVAPRSVAALDDGRVYVGDFLRGEVRVVDVAAGTVSQVIALAYPSSPTCTGQEERVGTQVAALAVGPKDGRLYAAHVQSRTTRSTGRWRDGSVPSLAQAVAPALATIDLKKNTLYAEEVEWSGNCFGPGCGRTVDFPPPLLVTDPTCGPPPGMDAPSAVVVDRSGEWLFVADHNSDAVAIVSSTRGGGPNYRIPERGLFSVIAVGTRPTGLALDDDNARLFVHNAFDYSVSVLHADVSGNIAELGRFTYDSSPLPPAVDRGRHLFYSAVDTRLTEPSLGGLSCASCHPEGGSDGLTWTLSDPDGEVRVRNTPALWGVTKTAPYHWDGVVASLPAFTERMIPQMGGDGLSARDVADLVAFLGTLEAPTVVARGEVGHGRAVFETHGCASCHAGDLLTDRRTHDLGRGPVDTPSLAGIGRTPPYFLDGSARTFGELLRSRTSGPHAVDLPDAERLDLEAYLRSL